MFFFNLSAETEPKSNPERDPFFWYKPPVCKCTVLYQRIALTDENPQPSAPNIRRLRDDGMDFELSRSDGDTCSEVELSLNVVSLSINPQKDANLKTDDGSCESEVSTFFERDGEFSFQKWVPKATKNRYLQSPKMLISDSWPQPAFARLNSKSEM